MEMRGQHHAQVVGPCAAKRKRWQRSLRQQAVLLPYIWLKMWLLPKLPTKAQFTNLVQLATPVLLKNTDC